MSASKHYDVGKINTLALINIKEVNNFIVYIPIVA